MTGFMSQRNDLTLFISLCLGFILATITGTVTHELAHYITASITGHPAQLHYASTTVLAIDGKPMIDSESFLITLAGPLQTMITGSIGFLLLLIYRKSFQRGDRLHTSQWLMVFVSLFWLRQVAVFLLWIGNYLVTGETSGRGDEIKLSRYLSLPGWFLISITAVTGICITLIIIFRFIPVKQRKVFIVSGITGGIAGYLLWMQWLGQLFIP